MALSLVGGAAIGALFGALYDVVKISIGKTAMQYKPLLSDLKFTLDSLRPRIIQQIGDQNMELGISNEDIESLQRQMEEGTELVRMLSNRGTWSCYILCSCCNCNKPSYAEQLVELDRSLRILLEILKLQEARDVKEVLLLARKINDKQGELERRLADLLKVQQESGDGGESSGSSAETTPHEQNGENGGQQVAPSGGGVGAAALGAAFGVLFDTVMQVKDKTTMLKRPLGDLKSTLDSVKPLIEEVAECSKVLNLPKEELEDVRIQMEKGAELVSNCSKVRQWTSYKTYEYTNKLLGLDESLQRLLTVLRVQLARDVRESLVSVSNIEVVINQIEGSGVVKLQNEQNEAKGSCEEPTAMAKSAVGLNTLSVEGTRDVSETLDPEANIKVGWQKVKESWVAQSKTEHPSRTVGLDAMDMQVGARSMEETSVSDVEAGLQQIQGKEVYELDVPFRELEEDVLKDEEDEELDEQVEDHHDRKKGAESVTGASGDGMASCKADGCAVDLSDAKAYYRRHRVCELHSKAPLVVVSGLKRRFCYKCSRFHDLSEFDDTKQSCRRHLPCIEQDGTGTQLKDVSGDIDTVISRIECSGVVQSQNDRSEIKDSYEVVEATPPAVGLNVPSVQRTRDSREILQTSVSNIEAGLKQILGKDVFDFEAPYAEYKETEFIPSSVTVDLGVLLRRLKRFFLNDEVSAVVLTGPAGSGKTTLAKFFCEDEEVKNIFKNNIFFVHVSENPSLSLMVQTLYQQMGFQMPVLQDESIALHSLHEFFMETALHPSVLVLDDVWPGSESLLDKFDEFKTSNYKIMVTSRYEFPAFSFPYYLKPLNAEDEIESLDDEDLICVSPPHSVTFDDKGLITHFPDSSASYLGDGSSHVATAIRPMDQFHDSCASILGDKNSYVPKDAGTMFPLDNPVKSTQTHMQRELELKKDSGEKLMKFAGSRNECGSLKAEVEESSAAGDNKPAEESTKPSESPKKDYIHVRARRGQATDSHSLAERVRREKISERMKILQDLVPGCNKVIGKARLLDEIINYIQSMQHQVEFLSMKLEAVNSRMNMNPTIEAFPPKDKDSGEKLMKFAGSRNESGSLKAEVEESSAAGDKQPAEESTKPSESPKQDYIHVKARRGQATDSQSLAERVRREQISERMKILQDLVPGCNKVVGKALLLDEIINYIQSLQHQVEFLSIKLAAVNPRMNMNPTIEAFPAEDLVAQPFDDAGLSFGSHKPREYDQSSQPEGLHMHVVGSFEKQRKFRG